MSPSINLFSRRKNSDDKALRAALAPQVNPYIYNASASSAPALSSLQQSAGGFQPPHFAPLPPLKTKNLSKAQPIVPGFAADGAGLVFAPHLIRARTSTFNAPVRENVQATSRKPLNRASSGFGRRTKSFDQRPPMEVYPEFTGAPLLDSARSQSIPPALQQGPTSLPEGPVSVNYSRAGSMRNRTPLSATGPSRGHPVSHSPASYSSASPHSVYPVSPPLSPESPLVNLIAEYEGIAAADGSGPGMEYESNDQRGDARFILGLGVSGYENGDEMLQQSNQLGAAKSIPTTEVEAAREARSRELAALMFEFEPQSFEPQRGSDMKDHDNIRQLRQRELELMDTIDGKERELEFLRSNSHGYREQIVAMEQVLAQKDGELGNARIRIHELNQHQARNRSASTTVSEMGAADMGRRLMEEIRRRERAEKLLVETITKAESNMQAVLIEEEREKGEMRAAVRREERIRGEAQQKSRGDLQMILGEEEKRRAELNWLFGEKIEKVERLRRNDLEEFHKSLAGLREDKERLEKQMRGDAQEIERYRHSVSTQREANEELIDMTRKINTRLGEEKKRNRKLEEKINEITMDAMNNVSGANREVVMLKNVIEDKDTKIEFFETELAAIKKEKKAMEDCCKDLGTELEETQRALLDCSERVKDLEQESVGVADMLEVYQKELDGRKQQADIAEQRTEISKLGETVKIVELKEDIELYKKDVRVYRKDVKKRDNQIKDLKRGVGELESLLESKTLETKVLQDALDVLVSYREDSPSTNGSSGSESSTPFRDEVTALKQRARAYEKEYQAMYDDYEVLRRKHELFVSQQAMIITDIDGQLTRVRKEKDAVEATTTRQLKKMQQGFLKLSQAAVAGQLAGIGAAAVAKNYQQVTLLSLPGDPLSTHKRSSSVSGGAGGKVETGRRQHPLSEGGFRADLSPVAEQVVGMGAVRVVSEEEDLRERTKLDRGMSAPYEPDEVFEW